MCVCDQCVCVLRVISIQNGQKRTGGRAWSGWRLGDAGQKSEKLRPLTWPGTGAGCSHPNCWPTTGLLGIMAKEASRLVGPVGGDATSGTLGGGTGKLGKCVLSF